MKGACTPDNVIGGMLAMRETDGHPVDIRMLEELDHSGKAQFAETSTQSGADVFDAGQPHEGDKRTLQDAASWLAGDSQKIAKDVFRSLRNPSGLFGEERIKPVIDFITNHHIENFDDLQGGRQAYFDEIGFVLDDVDTSDMSPSLLEAWEDYRRFYENGGELYGEHEFSPIGKAFSNLTHNVIKSSPTVILGNVMEGAIKLPTLYPKTFLPAIQKALQAGDGNIFKRIPELARKGVYELNEAGDRLGTWDGLIGLTDIPLKNIAYFAGELANGDGLKAVQDVAFINRFGDLPSVYYSGAGRSTVRFLSYTINTYKMYGNLWLTAKKGNPAPLLTYHAMAGLLGGGIAAGLPKGIEELIKAAAPETEDWFEENKAPWASLIQPGNINRLGITYDIASRQIQGAGRNVEKALEGAREGDIKTTALETGDALLRLMTLSSSPVGDVNVQKVLRLGKDVAEGEIDLEDVPEEATEKLLPFVRE